MDQELFVLLDEDGRNLLNIVHDGLNSASNDHIYKEILCASIDRPGFLLMARDTICLLINIRYSYSRKADVPNINDMTTLDIMREFYSKNEIQSNIINSHAQMIIRTIRPAKILSESHEFKAGENRTLTIYLASEIQVSDSIISLSDAETFCKTVVNVNDVLNDNIIMQIFSVLATIEDVQTLHAYYRFLRDHKAIHHFASGLMAKAVQFEEEEIVKQMAPLCDLEDAVTHYIIQMCLPVIDITRVEILSYLISMDFLKHEQLFKIQQKAIESLNYEMLDFLARLDLHIDKTSAFNLPNVIQNIKLEIQAINVFNYMHPYLREYLDPESLNDIYKLLMKTAVIRKYSDFIKVLVPLITFSEKDGHKLLSGLYPYFTMDLLAYLVAHGLRLTKNILINHFLTLNRIVSKDDTAFEILNLYDSQDALIDYNSKREDEDILLPMSIICLDFPKCFEFLLSKGLDFYADRDEYISNIMHCESVNIIEYLKKIYYNDLDLVQKLTLNLIHFDHDSCGDLENSPQVPIL